MTVDRSFTIIDAEVEGAVVDVRVTDGRIDAVAADLPRLGTDAVDAGGAALIPGLHDHHLHLLAMAASDRSVDVVAALGPGGFDDAVRDADRQQSQGRWLRVVGYDDGHGPLTPERLATLAPGRSVRVQHRSGAAWFVTGLDGWQHRIDDRLRSHWGDDEPLDLAAVARRLAAYGITGVTDATPFTDAGGFDLLAAARRRGDLPQRVTVTGGLDLADVDPPAELDRGPVKVVVADDALPSPTELVAAFRRARNAGRSVAVHCVTRIGLVLALVAWEEVGAVEGDRIEHGSVIPVELISPLAHLGVQVITQPAFVWDRGDRYLDEVDADDQPHLYRCRSLLRASIGVGGSTDAPFGPDDPWIAIAAAVDRRTRTGRFVNPGESIPASAALDHFLSAAGHPGGMPRRITLGAPADLVLLDAPLTEALATPSSQHVAATWIAGHRY